jgi:two-component system, sensor histidine kinase PdtaS
VKALENYLVSLEIWENIKNKSQVALVIDYLAELYEEQSNFTKSVDYYHKSLKIHEELSNKYKVARTLSNIGINCEQLGDYDKALKFDLRALTLFQEMDYKKDMARVYNSLGSAYIAKKDYMKAFDNLSNALNISERINDPFSKALTYNNLAHSYDKTNQPDKAIIFANKALVLAKKYNFANEIEKANLILSKGYASKNNFEQAYQYQKQHLEMRDSLFRQEQNKQLVEMTSKYESEKKEKQITALQLKDKQNQITIAQQQVGTTLILSVLVVFMILILFLYSRFRIKKKNAELLLIKNTEIRGRNLELQELSTQLQESLSEKETLLKEIHHRVKNNLQIISSLLNLQTHTLTDPKALEAVRDGQNRVKSMALIHQNLYQAENLASIDFQNYVEQLLSVLSITYEAAHKEIISSVHAQNIQLDIDTAIPIGLIINELVSNAYKYAFLKQEKGSIEIELAQLTLNDFRLTVQDNGVGLLEAIDWENPPTLGLKLVNILTNQINGILHIENQKGTRFIIDFTRTEDKKVA